MVLDLNPVALDWAVAEASGTPIYRSGETMTRMDVDGNVYWKPSTDWAQGGAIIEREGIGLERDDQGIWFASYDLSAETAWGATGKTPLEAAMRCYVSVKLGNDVELPEGLL